MFRQGEKLIPYPPGPLVMDRRWKPNVELAPNCPRCDSSNTKFCYYNNYSLTQPRYFCKNCRRYWTKGGSLRNVPVGGGCRKNRRRKSVRVSTDCVTAGNSSYGGAQPGLDCSRFPPDNPINGNLYYSDLNPMVASSTDATRSDPSTIDLAVVYAKFLNQVPDPDPGIGTTELSREFDVSFDLPSISDPIHDPHFQFSQQHGLVECQGPSDQSTDTQLSELHQVFLGEFDMNHKQQERIPQFTSLDINGYGLQPLPVEEVGIQDLFWSNPLMVSSNFMWQATQLQTCEPIHEDRSTLESNQLNGNWSSFDLPSYEAFSKP